MNENRVLTPSNILEISMNLEHSRKLFLDKVEEAFKGTIVFSQHTSRAIGEISLEEAIQGIIEYFNDEMRKS